MAAIDLTKYGITGATEIVYNPSYETLYEEEMKPELTGFDKIDCHAYLQCIAVKNTGTARKGS